MDTTIVMPDVPKREVLTSLDAPWYFGAYLNQARHNLFMCLNELSIKLKSNPVEKDDDLLSTSALRVLSNGGTDPVKVEIAMKYYEKHLPFLFIMQKAKVRQSQEEVDDHIQSIPSIFYDILKRLISILNKYRHAYSHYNEANNPDTDKELISWLKDVFQHNIDVAKVRFDLSEEEVSHLREPEINKENRDNTTAPFYYSFEENNRFTDNGLAFFICLFLSKGEIQLFLKKLSGFKRSDEKKFKATLEVFNVSSIRLPKERLESNNSPQAFFLDMCNELERCPEQLYKLLHPDDQKLFIKTDDAEGYIDFEEEDGEDIGGLSLHVRKENRFPYFALRYLDISEAMRSIRFGIDLGTYYYSIYPKTFAGIDETRLLNKHLIGAGRLDEFTKANRPEAFANLVKSIEETNAAPMDPYIRAATPHYHIDNNNVLLYQNHSAALWPSIKTETVTGKSYPNKLLKNNTLLPYAVMSIHELPAMLLYHLLQNKDNLGTKVEDVIRNHVKMVHSLFRDIQNNNMRQVSTYPCRKEEPDERNRITEFERRMNIVSKQVYDKYQLRLSWIPDRIINYLVNLEPENMEVRALAQLRNISKQIKTDLRRLDTRIEQITKNGVRGAGKIKVGVLAQQLAEDMLLMQPVERDANGLPIPSSKANNLAFRLLQSHLAYFSINKQKLEEIFTECRLINAVNSHPFLSRVNLKDCNGVVDFYKFYFTKKEEYIQDCLKKKQWGKYYFITAGTSKSEVKDCIRQYLNENNSKANHTPFNLPKGLFLDETLKWLEKYGDDGIKKELSEKAETNSVYLMNQLFNQAGTQPFYTGKRHYRLFDRKENSFEYLAEVERRSKGNDIARKVDKARRISEKKTGKDLKKENERKDAVKFLSSYRFFLESEKQIRLLAAQDKLLFMCINDLLKRHVKDISLVDASEITEGTFSLSNINPDNNTGNKSLLNYQPAGGILLSKPFFQTDKTGSFVKNGVTLMEVGKVSIFDNTLKIKNAGNFRRFARDRRINNLCFFFQQDESGQVVLHRMILENEFHNYDKMRLPVLKKIMAFEKRLYDCCTEAERKDLHKENYKDQKETHKHHQYFLDVFRKKFPGVLDEDTAASLAQIRNAFMHNTYPLPMSEAVVLKKQEWEVMNNSYRPAEQGSTRGYGIIEKITEFANRYDDLVGNLNN